ncbi:MAG: DUF3638 domain-containing protein [Parachlamydiaceae bacterium]|nr:DUF3638 domain-containing protein [Parachlamydiaceae bacterium]
MDNTKLQDNLNKLDAILSCVETPVEKNQTEIIQNISAFLSKITLFFKRTYFSLAQGQWLDNKVAAKTVKNYVFKITTAEKNSDSAGRIHEIYKKLISLEGKDRLSMEGIESSWITDPLDDELPSFHRVRKMSSSRNTHSASHLSFHMQANEFGKNNQSFEGSKLETTLGALADFLNERSEQQGLPIYGLTQEDLNSINGAVQLTLDFTGIEDKIEQAFTAKEAMLLPGGWAGVPSGHAMVYEIIPNLDDSDEATFRLFNLGAGAEIHYGGIVGNKIKRLPYIDFTGVSKKNLLDKNVLSAIRELQTNAFLPGSDSKTNYETKDVYQGFLALFKLTPEAVITHEDSPVESLKTTQFSGLCAWRSPMAFISTKMLKDHYKQLICDMKLQNLIDRVSVSHKETFSRNGWWHRLVDFIFGKEVVSKAQWKLLDKSHQKLSRTIAKAFDQGIVGSQYAMYASYKLQKLSGKIEEMRDPAYKPEPQVLNPNKRSWEATAVNLNSFNLTHQPLHEQLESASNKMGTQPCSFAYESIQSSFSKEYEEALKEILLSAETALQAGEEQALNIALVDWMRQLDAKDFAETFEEDPEKAKDVMEDLGKLSKIFFETCLRLPDAYVVHPDKQYALTKLLYLQQQLAIIIEPENLKLLQFNLSSNDSLFFKVGDTTIHEEFYRIVHSLDASADSFRAIQKELEILRVEEQALERRENDLLSDKRKLFGYSEKNKMNVEVLKIDEELNEITEMTKFVEKKCDEKYELLKKNHDLMNKKGNYNFNHRFNLGESSYFHFITDRKNWAMESQIQDLFPDVVKELSVSNPDFIFLDEAQKNAYMYASDKLPEWFKSMRDTHLYLLYLSHECIGNPPIEKIDCSLILRVKKLTDDWAEIYFSVKGLTGDLIKQYSEVKKIRDKPILRYAGFYRPFQCPKLGKLINHCAKEAENKYRFEKNILASHVSDYSIGISDELFKEIKHILLHDELRIAKAFAYFTKSPAKLAIPDYQSLFQIFMFEKNALINEFKIPGFTDKFAEFMQTQLDRYTTEGNIQTSVFLLRMCRLFERFAPDKMEFQGSIDKLRALLEKVGLEPEDKSVIYGELVAALSKKQKLDPEDHLDLLIGTAYLQENPIPLKWSCPQTNKEVGESLHIHARSIEDTLIDASGEPNTNLLNTIKRKMKGGGKRSWEATCAKGQFSYFTSDRNPSYTYYPLTSRLLVQNMKVSLPSDIRQHPHFQQLFSSVSKGTIKGANFYRFKDRSGNKTLIRKMPNVLIIEQERDGKWYQFVPREAFLYEIRDEKFPQSVLASRHLVENFNHWQNLDEPSLVEIVDAATNEPYAQACLKEEWGYGFTDRYGDPLPNPQNVVSVKRYAQELQLGKAQTVLTHFEDASFIQEWYEDSLLSTQLRHVELPRFNLSFTYDVKNSRLASDQFNEGGFFLSTEQYVSALGAYTHYLVLENDKGEKKILIPNHWLANLEDDRESLEAKHAINQNLAPENDFKQSYGIYILNANGELVSGTKKSNLFLSYIYSAVQEYGRAAKLLRKYAVKLSSYSNEEELLLSNIIDLGEIVGDSSGNGIAARTFATYLLIKNKTDHTQTVNKELRKCVAPLLSDYLSHYSNITELKLTPEEEAFLIKFALNDKFDTKLFIRLEELDPSYAKQYVLPLVKEDKMSVPRDDVAMTFTKMFSNQECPSTAELSRGEELKIFDFSKMLITRVGGYMQSNFFDLYEIARIGSDEDKKRLKKGLIFFRHQEGAPWGKLLECVLQNPEAFSPPDIKHVDHEQRNKWWSNVLAVADDVGAGKLNELETFQKAPMEVANLTQEDFRLDDEQYLPPAIEVKCSAPKLTTFNDLCDQNECFKIIPFSRKKKDLLKGWLNKEVNAPASKEPLYKQVIAGFAAEITDEKVNLPAVKYELNVKGPEDGLGNIEEMLASGKIESESKLIKLKSAILKLANRLPLDAQASLLKKLRQQGASEKVITLEDLLVYFGRMDTISLQQRNPALDATEITRLFSKIAKYLVISTKEQQRSRAHEQLNIVKDCLIDEDCSNDELQEQVQELAERLLATRQFKSEKKPAYLVFEYYANILLRESQVIKLKQLLKDGDLNPVMEMIMGSGKSKVLLPLIGLLRADGVVLSTVIVAKPFFESVSSDTQQILAPFSQSVRALHFDRNTVFSTFSLKMIRDDLKAVQKNKECLIMTSSSVQCFMLKFIEQCKISLSKGEFPEELMLMREILGLLGTSGNPLVDEADTIYNVLHELSFSLGDKLSVNSRDLKVISEIYSILYSDPCIKAAARIDFDPEPNMESPVLTEELYNRDSRIKTILAERFIENLETLIFDSDELTQETQGFFVNLGLNASVEEKEAAIHYLCRDPKHIKKAQLFYDQQSNEIQNILALAAEEISGFLPHTLTRKCDEKYGLDTDDQGNIAIPYAAANTPNFGSQFAKSYITMNYTYQYYLKKGVSREIVVQEIERLQSKAMKELKETPSMPLEKTEAWQTFLKLRGNFDVPLFNLREGQINKIVEEINSTPAQKSNFVSDIILPQLELFSHKSSCNPHNLAALYLILLGFTGTLWNSKSMHTKLQARPEPGMDMRTIKVLWEHSRHEVYTVEEESPESLLAELEEQNISFDMISDAGGYFKEGGNTAIARQMALTNGRPVVFYNERNEQVETNGKTEVLLTESKTRISDRDTFLDQSHTTGADVKQKPNAVGIVTIGGNMLLRDLLQAVWRLRGLEKGQRVKFVVSKEVESIIRQRLKAEPEEFGDEDGEKEEVPLQFDDILRFLIINQVRQQGKDNFKAFRQELSSVVQSLLFDLLLSEKFSVDEMAEAFSVLEKEWIKEACKEPRDLHGIIGHEEDSIVVLEQERNKSIIRLDEIFEELPFLENNGITKEDALTRVDAICEAHVDSLPAKVTVPLRDTDSDQTVERQQETQQETQTELEVQEHKEKGKTTLGNVGLRVSENPVQLTSKIFERYSWASCLSMGDCCQFDPALEGFSDAFKGIRISINALEWPARMPQLTDLRLLGNHRTLLEFVKVVNEGRDLIILSQEDANREKTEGNFFLSLYNLTTGFNDKTQPVSKELFEKIVKVKFLSGESSYTKPELEFLEEWFNEQGKERMLDLFQTKILAGHPDKAADYNNGNLRDLLHN